MNTRLVTLSPAGRFAFAEEDLVPGPGHRFRLAEIQTAFETVAREGGRCLKGIVLVE